jgi:uracil-DNA glycosylase family 4
VTEKHLVLGLGPTTAEIILVGEAPGEREERIGQPFVGMAGQLLNSLLKAAGIVRNYCYITNVVKERPPSNNIKVFIDLGKKQILRTAAYEFYERELATELAKINSNIIVAFGQTALYALTGQHDRITQRRGSLYESTLLPGRKVIACLHPAAALRMYNYQHLIVFDLKRAKEEAQFPELKLPQYQLLTEPSFEDVAYYLDYILEEHPLIAFDIEVVNEEVSHISFSDNPNRAVCIPFISNGREYFTLEKEAIIWNKIALILENPYIRKIAQNRIFDGHFLFRRYGIKVHNCEDTMIGQGIANTDFRKGLDFICSIHTRIPYYKDEGKKWMDMGGSEIMFREYNAKDSIVLQHAWPSIVHDLNIMKNYDIYQQQNMLVEPLTFMQERGIRMDVEGIKQKRRDNETRIAKLTEELNQLCGKVVNYGSPKQLSEYFYIEKGIKPYTKNGRITTDETAMIRLARKGFKEAEVILQLRRLSKMNSNYYNTDKISSDGRLRTAYNPVGTVSGRLSSGESIFGEGNNVQNQPHEVREFMLPDDGNIMFSIDLSQAELRIVANIAPESKMIEALEHGDIHALTAETIMNLYYRGKVPEGVTVLTESPLGNGTYNWRFWGKKANLGLNYGQGYKKFALQNQLQERDAKMIVDGYFRMYPGIRTYQKWVIQELYTKSRRLTNPFGRSRIFLDRWGQQLFNAAFDFIPQSTVGDIINSRGINYIYFSSNFAPVILVNQVHDSIEFEVPVSTSFRRIAEMLLSIKASLETPITWRGREFSVPAELKAGGNLKDADDDNPRGLKRVKLTVVNNVAEQLKAIWRLLCQNE